MDDAIDFEFDENDSDNSFDLDLGAESHVSCLFFTNVFLLELVLMLSTLWWLLLKSAENDQLA